MSEITYEETNRGTTTLSDSTPVEVVTYNVLYNGNVVAYNQVESQVLDTRAGSSTYDQMMCWHNIRPVYVLQAQTFDDYVTNNSSGQSYLPRPKGTKNPGGSPIKY